MGGRTPGAGGDEGRRGQEEEEGGGEGGVGVGGAATNPSPGPSSSGESERSLKSARERNLLDQMILEEFGGTNEIEGFAASLQKSLVTFYK